jgi:hypothetical protein
MSGFLEELTRNKVLVRPVTDCHRMPQSVCRNNQIGASFLAQKYAILAEAVRAPEPYPLHAM